MSPHALSVATTHEPMNASATSGSRRAPRTGDVLASGRSARADIHEISVVPVEPGTVVARYADAIEKFENSLADWEWTTGTPATTRITSGSQCTVFKMRRSDVRRLDFGMNDESIRMKWFRATSEPSNRRCVRPRDRLRRRHAAPGRAHARTRTVPVLGPPRSSRGRCYRFVPRAPGPRGRCGSRACIARASRIADIRHRREPLASPSRPHR